VCGFGGVMTVDRASDTSKNLEEISSALKHRGPDDEGKWIQSQIGLVHRRLSILDQSNLASQPMTSNDKRYVLVYNGEIYNFTQIKEELFRLGVSFKSTGDTEVVLHALIKWGAKAIPKFNGMFSFVFFDSHENKAILARDRYGIKPLYIYCDNNTIVFASEEKALVRHPIVRVKLDVLALSEYFTFQNIFTNKTFFEGIEQLAPGTYMETSLQGNLIKSRIIQYWDFVFKHESHSKNLNEQREEIERLFSLAVTRCLMSDVSVGQYLSGGIDTALIATETSKIIENIPTFTIGFNLENTTGLELGFDERGEAQALSNFLRTSHSEQTLQSGDMQSCLSDLNFTLDTPRVGQSYPNYYAASLASRSVRVVLSGTGSDEIFGGYPWRYFAGFPSTTSDEYAKKYYQYWQRIVSDEDQANLFRPIWNSICDYKPQHIFSEILRSHRGDNEGLYGSLNRSLYLEAKTFLPGLLNVEDKIHMRFGIENRVPFLDNDLVDFALQIDPSLKIPNFGKNTYRIDENQPGNKKGLLSPSQSGKYILREIYKSRLPDFEGWQYKKGFAAPDATWFRGPSMEFIRREILNPSHQMYEYLDYKYVVKVLDRHLSGAENRRLFLWSILSLKNWLDLNL
jgi:asparagine synthase (glutamine-hydrolysing)